MKRNKPRVLVIADKDDIEHLDISKKTDIGRYSGKYLIMKCYIKT
jgi:hypothetical protein